MRELIAMGLVREAWGARVAKYEHEAGKSLGVQSKALALLCPLILRGPQTLGELKIHSQRLFAFDDLDDLMHMLQRLAEHEPALVVTLPRQPGQKEERFAHLLCGEPVIPEVIRSSAPAPARQELEERINALEAAVTELELRLTRLEPDVSVQQTQDD